jgi:hypothetical protein
MIEIYSMKKLTPFLLLFLLFVSLQWLSSFSKSIIPSYLLGHSISPNLMLLSLVFMFGTQIILQVLFRKINSSKAWIVSVFCTLGVLLSIYSLYHPFQVLLMGMFSGAPLFLFWLPYNIMYFSHSPKNKTASRSGLMFSISPLIGIIAPFIAGQLAEKSLTPILIGSLVFSILPLVLIRTIKPFYLNINLSKSWNHIRTFQIPLITGGIWEALVIAIIPILSLYFFPRPSSYGMYLSYLSIVSVGANLLLGHISDKIKKRRTILLPIATILLISTLFIPWAMTSIKRYVLVTSIIQFFLPIYWNITTALFVDRYPKFNVSFPGREMGLALGRFIGIGITYILFVMNIQNLILYPILALSLGGFIVSLVFLKK